MIYIILYFLIGHFVGVLTIFIYKFIGAYKQFDNLLLPPIFFAVLFWPLTIIVVWPMSLLYKLEQKVNHYN